MYYKSHRSETTWTYHASATHVALASSPLTSAVQTGLYHVQVTTWSGPPVLGRWCPASRWQRTASPSISQLQNMRCLTNPEQFRQQTFLLLDPESGTICHRNCDTLTSGLDNSETCWNRISVGFSQPRCIVTFYYCALEAVLLTYLLTYNSGQFTITMSGSKRL